MSMINFKLVNNPKFPSWSHDYYMIKWTKEVDDIRLDIQKHFGIAIGPEFIQELYKWRVLIDSKMIFDTSGKVISRTYGIISQGNGPVVFGFNTVRENEEVFDFIPRGELTNFASSIIKKIYQAQGPFFKSILVPDDGSVQYPFQDGYGNKYYSTQGIMANDIDSYGQVLGGIPLLFDKVINTIVPNKNNILDYETAKELGFKEGFDFKTSGIKLFELIADIQDIVQTEDTYYGFNAYDLFPIIKTMGHSVSFTNITPTSFSVSVNANTLIDYGVNSCIFPFFEDNGNVRGTSEEISRAKLKYGISKIKSINSLGLTQNNDGVYHHQDLSIKLKPQIGGNYIRENGNVKNVTVTGFKGFNYYLKNDVKTINGTLHITGDHLEESINCIINGEEVRAIPYLIDSGKFRVTNGILYNDFEEEMQLNFIHYDDDILAEMRELAVYLESIDELTEDINNNFFTLRPDEEIEVETDRNTTYMTHVYYSYFQDEEGTWHPLIDSDTGFKTNHKQLLMMLKVKALASWTRVNEMIDAFIEVYKNKNQAFYMNAFTKYQNQMDILNASRATQLVEEKMQLGVFYTQQGVTYWRPFNEEEKALIQKEASDLEKNIQQVEKNKEILATNERILQEKNQEIIEFNIQRQNEVDAHVQFLNEMEQERVNNEALMQLLEEEGIHNHEQVIINNELKTEDEAWLAENVLNIVAPTMQIIYDIANELNTDIFSAFAEWEKRNPYYVHNDSVKAQAFILYEEMKKATENFLIAESNSMVIANEIALGFEDIVNIDLSKIED